MATTLSRFVTDLLHFSGADRQFIDLPDELTGVSSAMPHKRNFPVLERIRGLTGHLAGLAVDLMIGQRNTNYTNLVEVGKESTRLLGDFFDLAGVVLVLLSEVIVNVRFDVPRAQRAAEDGYLADSVLANHLTLAHRVPTRTAHIAVGRWITELERGDPACATNAMLADTCVALGHPVAVSAAELDRLLDVRASVSARRTSGSTSPAAVTALLDALDDRIDKAAAAVDGFGAEIRSARPAFTAGAGGGDVRAQR